MVNHALEGDFTEARKMHYNLLNFMNAIFMDGNLAE